MNDRSWAAKTREELMIEVWEKLDCESVGSAELEAVETVVRDVFGVDAVQPPMVMARLLADEGAELRHYELMDLHLKRMAAQTYDPAIIAIGRAGDLKSLLEAIRGLERLRTTYSANGNKKGLARIKNAALAAKQGLIDILERRDARPVHADQYSEMASWITLWLQSGSLFEQWVSLRRESAEFKVKFGDRF